MKVKRRFLPTEMRIRHLLKITADNSDGAVGVIEIVFGVPLDQRTDQGRLATLDKLELVRKYRGYLRRTDNCNNHGRGNVGGSVDQRDVKLFLLQVGITSIDFVEVDSRVRGEGLDRVKHSVFCINLSSR